MGDIVDVYDGTHQTPKYTSSGVKFVSVENISNLETEKYISQEVYEKEYANKQTSKGDVLMTRIGDIGTARVVETTEPLAYYVTLSLLKPKLVESDFLAWLIASPEVQHNIWKRTLHIAFPKKINLGEIKQVETTIPKKTEQEKIGIFFKQLDNLITLHQRKLISVQKLHFGLIKKEKNGLNMQFLEYSNVWEQRKLGDLGTVAMNKRIFKEQTTATGDVPFYKIGTFGSTPDAFISRELFEEYKEKYPFPQKGDLLISASGSIGRIVEYTGADEYFQDSNIVWLKHDNRLENIFLRQFYNIVKWQGLEGSTIKRLYNKNILETTICIPSSDEQRKIGSFFKQLDNLITLHQRKTI